MGQLKKGMILLLTLMCICLMAFLPRITGRFQDREALHQVGYSQSSHVQLKIREDIPLIGKLSLLSRMKGVLEVPEDLTEMTADKAEQAALDALRPYMDAGLIPEFTVWYIEARPLLILTSDEADLAGVIWSVTILDDEEGIINITIDIDDATGALLRLVFNYEFWGKTDLPDTLLRFAEVYFTGIEVEAYEKFATDDLENRYIGDDTVGIRYRIEDPVYGEVNLDLYVHQYGFYVTTPTA